MENDQKDGSTLVAATTDSISATNLKTVETPIISKSVDGEVNQNSVANCNKSISSGISGSASDVPVTLSASKTEKEDEVLVNKTSLNVSNSEINDKQSVSDVAVNKSVTDDKPLPDSLDNSLKDDSVLSEGSSHMEQTLVNDKSAQESEGKDVVDQSTPKSNSLLVETRQIYNKTIQEDEAMDVDESLTISNDNESASKDSTSQVVEADNGKCELIDSNPSSGGGSVGVSEGKKVAESGSKKLRSIVEDSKDQDDSNQMLGLDESSTNLSESSAKFVVHDCDEDLSQDDVQEVASIDPFAQTGEESMEVDEGGDVGNKNSEESGVKKNGDESKEKKEGDESEEEEEEEKKGDESEEKEGDESEEEEKKKKGDESEEKEVGDEIEKKLEDVTENSVESVDKDKEKVEGKENSDNNENEMGSAEKESKEKKDSKEECDKSADEKIGVETVEKVADKAMEVDGKQVTSKEAVEVVDEEKEEEEEEEEKSKEVVETDKIEDVNSSDKEVAEKERENSSGKHVPDKKGENSSREIVVEEDDDDDDCVIVLEDGEKGSEECSVQKKGDDGEVSKEGEKDVESKEGEKNKDIETSHEEGGDSTSVKVTASSSDKPSAEGDGVDSTTSDKVADSSSDKLSSTSSDDVTKKNVESSKEATKDKGGAEIEIDEDICIIPDTVRLPPDQGKVGNSSILIPTPSTAASTSSTPSGSGGKVLNEVSSLTNRIKVVKMETVVKQETPTSSRPKRQAATKADAQIKATVKELDRFNEEEGEKENEEVDENIQLCKQCAKVKPCKFNILNKNKVVSHLCSEDCAIQYKNTLLAADKARGVGAGVAGGASGGGNVHINEAGEFVRSCSQCRNRLTMGESVLSWETMDFCNEDCLGKYQTCLGSHCAYCKKGVQQTSLGKYCVRFGYHIRQFCSSSCLEEYKRGLKVCSFCQKDISSSETGFLAPVGDKGTFKDFCTQHCMEQYDRLSNNQPAPAEMHCCDVCTEKKVVDVQVLVDSKLSKLCSEVCFAAFKFVNHEVTVDQCDMCHKYFDRNTLRSDNLTVYYDDNQHNFCCKTCMNAYILGKRKIVPCNWCKVKKYNFDMIKRVLETGQTLMMCSLNCLTLYKVSINAVSSRRIKCDNCNSVSQAQYHLTMSDATIRNFCTYPCVMNFQGQYSKNPITLPGGQKPPIPTGGPKRAIISGVTSPKDIRPSVPIISSVTSLATTNGQTATSHLQSPTVVNSLSPVVSSVASNAATSAKSTVQSVGTVSAGTVAASTATAMKTTCNNYVIIREKNPPKMANKCTSFRPTTHTKGVSCRPHSCSQEMQTDVSGGDGKTVIVPIPVPVYIPVPVHMYSMPTPVPIPFPVPVPVPIFIPTTRNSAQGIMDEIQRIHEKMPTDPFEAELLMMAQAVAEKKHDSEGSAAPSEGAASPERSVSPAEDVASEMDGDEGASLPVSCEIATPSEDLDAELTPTTITAQKRRSLAASVVSENDEDVDDPDPVETPTTKRKRGRPSMRGGWSGGGSAKRGRRSTSNSSSSNHLTAYTPPSTNTTPAPLLKFMLGVQAYKQWIQNRNVSVDTAESSPKRPKQLKADLLQQTPEELNYSLTLFVREARKPSGDPYPPDTSFYFCLGIQYYLLNNGRTENIFTDAYFDTFTDALQEVVQHFPSALRETPVIVTRVEEEHLWESKQLGAHSPHVLLCTLMFFNTKYFNLVTVEDHMNLSFSNIMKHWKKGGSTAPVTGTRNVLLRYYPSGGDSAKRSSTGKRLTYEQHENEDDPLRCPVKLYEFYLSKCPESVKSKGELFYLQPERSCVPDSPVWYSTQSISEEALSKVLNRITMVKEINVAVVKA